MRRQLPGVKHILSEPAGRNTAPCVAWAAQYIEARDPQAVMVVVPSDSHIADVKQYRRVVASALALAGKEPVLITVGIKPDRPATGYGYIEMGKPLAAGFWKAKRFVEKPDLATARRFVASGRYRWNAGMFVWSAPAVRAAFEQHAPAVWRGVKDDYAKVEKISVDYAIMEKAGNVVVANGSFDWDDVGDWPAVARHYRADESGNVGRGNIVHVETRDCVVVTDDNHLVAVVGLKDAVVVHTKDATLVCAKDQAQKVRDVARRLAGRKNWQRYL